MSRNVPNDLSPAQMAERSGVPVSTLHYYEAEGLIQSWRTPANHRRYDRRELRRVALIRVAQSLGASLTEIREVFDGLPTSRKLKKEDWQGAADHWREALEDRIELLLRLRDQLGDCIACGCLSLESCPLYNADDKYAANGPGPRRWTGEVGERRSAPPID